MPRLAAWIPAALWLAACGTCAPGSPPAPAAPDRTGGTGPRVGPQEATGTAGAPGEPAAGEPWVKKAALDLLADPERLEAGAGPGSRFADLARASGLWILRGRGPWRTFETTGAGGLEGIELGEEPLVLRLAAGDAASGCMRLLVGTDGKATVHLARVAGRRSSTSVTSGGTLVDGPCPVGEEPIQDYSVKATGARTVLAGVWLAPKGTQPALTPPRLKACAQGKGVGLEPGTSVRAAALAPPGAHVAAIAAGTGAPSLEVTIHRDSGVEPLEIELSRKNKVHKGWRAIKGQRPQAVEVVASLPAGARGEACLRSLEIRTDAAAGKRRPRTFDAVVVIMTDTMRGDLYPYEGSRMGVKMPNMQALAGRSTVFAQATAHSSYTKPSVGTILTGLYPEQHGGLARKAPISDGVSLVSEILEKAGVRTVSFLSNFFFNPSFGMRRGWTETHFIDPWQAALDDTIVIEDFERWCQGGVPEGPLFVYVHLMGAHAPYSPPTRIRKAFLEGRSLSSRLSPRHTAQLIKDLTSGKEPRLSNRERSQLEALYRADAAYHDEVLGHLLEAMEASGLLERALLIYTSDHGEEFYEHGRVGHGTGLWHEQVHVPLVVHAPGQKSSITSTALVGHVDVAPTILEALGAPVPESLPGRNLIDLIDPTGPESRPLILEHWTGRWGIQLGPWKLQRRPADERLSWSFEAEEDELEPDSLPVLHLLLRKELAWSYLALGAAADEQPALELPQELTDQLEKLGYIVK